MQEHISVLNLLTGAQHRRHVPGLCSLGLSTSYTFDVFVHVLFSAIGYLGVQCFLIKDTSSLLTLVSHDHVSHLSGVPSVMSQVHVPLAVTHVDVAGEALTRAVVDAVRPSVRLLNSFGPTEMAVYVTRKEVMLADVQHRLASIGKPLPNVTSIVVDPTSLSPSPQPTHMWGELWLGGVQVARGYLNRPHLTAHRFVPNLSLIHI